MHTLCLFQITYRAILLSLGWSNTFTRSFCLRLSDAFSRDSAHLSSGDVTATNNLPSVLLFDIPAWSGQGSVTATEAGTDSGAITMGFSFWTGEQMKAISIV